MNAPQIILIVLLAAELGIVLVKNGQPRENYSLGITVISTIVIVGLLTWGGFWS